MSVRDNVGSDLRHRPFRSVKPKHFADCSAYNFNSLSPDLSTIVEESPGECIGELLGGSLIYSLAER
eukprot:1139964-Rhodomonas_salina.1